MILQKALTKNKDDDFYTFLPVLYSKLGENFYKLSDWFNAQKYYELAEEFYISTGDTEKSTLVNTKSQTFSTLHSNVKNLKKYWKKFYLKQFRQILN